MDKIQVNGLFWYEISLWDNPQGDNLYHANIYKENQYNLVHTTCGYLSIEDCTIAAHAIIDFITNSESTDN